MTINNNLNEHPTLSPTDADNNAMLTDRSADNKLPAPDYAADKAKMAMNTGDGYLELLEERPIVNKERLDIGRVTVTKHTRTKTIEVPIELIEEYITVQTEYHDAESQDLLSGSYDDKDILRHVEPSLASNAVVTINDKQVTIGDAPIEIIISRQVATITKETYAIQEVAISKSVHTHVDNIAIELKHEELDVREEGFLDHNNTPLTK
ncbi:YsnF/AvaK domain-containing protein [Psychrobacter urativorans]|uniref:YsnF/AvaK domain-containing protein n=1 Tax=Psychrobacter urativorans TaxID=45610 RepID=UPI0019182941|nr:YsnF/AvaK domain-containing protein [Psychrobacter urativorans]